MGIFGLGILDIRNVRRTVFLPLGKLSHGPGLQSVDCIITRVFLFNIPCCTLSSTAHRFVCMYVCMYACMYVLEPIHAVPIKESGISTNMSMRAGILQYPDRPADKNIISVHVPQSQIS